MENFATMSVEDKVYALQMEIRAEEGYLENTSKPWVYRNRRKYIKGLEKQLNDLLAQHTEHRY